MGGELHFLKLFRIMWQGDVLHLHVTGIFRKVTKNTTKIIIVPLGDAWYNNYNNFNCSYGRMCEYAETCLDTG